MLEVEMKFPAVDFAGIERLLMERGAVRDDLIDETDHYFNAPDRDFARTDEALRVRQILSVSSRSATAGRPYPRRSNYVTYKGPKRDAQTKTRTEVEVPLAEGKRAANDFMNLLAHLGYRPVASVHKKRTIYRLREANFALEVCLDDVEEIGHFVELELMAPEEELDAARRRVLSLAAELGLANSERRSYLEMLLAKREKG